MSATGLIHSAWRSGSARLAAFGARRLWLVAASFLLACAALVLASLQGYHAIHEELTRAALLRRVAVAQLAATTVSEKFEHLVDVGVALATRVRFRQLIAEGRWEEAVAILREVPRDLPFIERLFIANPEGVLMVDVPERPDVRGLDFSHREWYQGVRRHWEPYVSPAYQRAALPRFNVFAAATPIRDEAGRVLGVLVLQMRLEAYFEWIKGIDVGQRGSVYIVDPKGQLAFDSHSRDLGEIADVSWLPVVQKLQRGEQDIEIAFDPIRREEAVSAFSPVRPYGWGVVVRQPARDAFLARDQQLRRLLFAYALVMLLGAAVFYLGARFVLHRRQAEQAHSMQVELERRVAERTAQLEAANRELEGFSYSVSHDLRSPLRAIDGFSRILQEDYPDRLDDEGRRLLAVIRDNSQKMGQLIDDLLEFSRLGRKPLSMSDTDMGRLASEVFHQLEMPGKHAPRLVLSALPPARGDPALLRQVWVNLLGNAVKFSSQRGQPVIEVSGEGKGGEIVYCVKDNGAGFDMRYYDKLFGVFQRLHGQDEYPGTGVGLAIVQRVVTRHGGRVWAEGRPGEGATFYFSLPGESGDGRV